MTEDENLLLAIIMGLSKWDTLVFFSLLNYKYNIITKRNGLASLWVLKKKISNKQVYNFTNGSLMKEMVAHSAEISSLSYSGVNTFTPSKWIVLFILSLREKIYLYLLCLGIQSCD